MLIALFVFVSSAFASPFVIDGSGVTVNHACTAAEAVTISATGSTITLTGDCGAITISGSTNTVTLDGVAKLSVTGTVNTVSWSRNLSGARKLPVTNRGVGNTVRKL